MGKVKITKVSYTGKNKTKGKKGKSKDNQR